MKLKINDKILARKIQLSSSPTTVLNPSRRFLYPPHIRRISAVLLQTRDRLAVTGPFNRIIPAADLAMMPIQRSGVSRSVSDFVPIITSVVSIISSAMASTLLSPMEGGGRGDVFWAPP
ncbi:unnamed protein product [Linum trigynum]|uniref:Uncharacterized protein n=1 Tax=Linum trigynum TaxID=586398 RepID=A0AAV2G974_9ROSI